MNFPVLGYQPNDYEISNAGLFNLITMIWREMRGCWSGTPVQNRNAVIHVGRRVFCHWATSASPQMLQQMKNLKFIGKSLKLAVHFNQNPKPFKDFKYSYFPITVVQYSSWRANNGPTWIVIDFWWKQSRKFIPTIKSASKVLNMTMQSVR